MFIEITKGDAIYPNIPLVIYLSPIIWIFPAIQQYKEKSFLFFLVIAIGDPIGFIIMSALDINLGPIHPLIVSSILAIVVINRNTLKTHWLKIFIIVFILILFSILIKHKNIYYVNIVLFHIYVFYVFLALFIKGIFSRMQINIFYLLLIFYVLLNMFKVNNLIFNFTNAEIYHYTTSIFQILLGIFFSFVKESSPKNLIKLGNG